MALSHREGAGDRQPSCPRAALRPASPCADWAPGLDGALVPGQWPESCVCSVATRRRPHEGLLLFQLELTFSTILYWVQGTAWWLDVYIIYEVPHRGVQSPPGTTLSCYETRDRTLGTGAAVWASAWQWCLPVPASFSPPQTCSPQSKSKSAFPSTGQRPWKRPVSPTPRREVRREGCCSLRVGLVPVMCQRGRTLRRGTHSAWLGHAGSIPFLSEHNDSSLGHDQLASVQRHCVLGLSFLIFPPLPSPHPTQTHCHTCEGAAGVGPERYRWACRLLEEKGTGKQGTGSVLE